jgi:hypothetical protein
VTEDVVVTGRGRNWRAGFTSGAGDQVEDGVKEVGHGGRIARPTRLWGWTTFLHTAAMPAGSIATGGSGPQDSRPVNQKGSEFEPTNRIAFWLILQRRIVMGQGAHTTLICRG